jgi:hypothetical protein
MKDKRERTDDLGQKRRGHWYYYPSQTTAYIDYRDRRSVSDRDHAHGMDLSEWYDYDRFRESRKKEPYVDRLRHTVHPRQFLVG